MAVELSTERLLHERERFEAWARVALARNPERELVRSRAGGYVMAMTQAAWAAWQGRASFQMEN